MPDAIGSLRSNLSSGMCGSTVGYNPLYGKYFGAYALPPGAVLDQ